MKHMMLISLLLAGCSGSAETGGEDPCAGEDLPECPAECPDDYAATCGEPCETDGEACGNSIGDGRVCLDGIWSCSVHAPLEAEGCNQICQ